MRRQPLEAGDGKPGLCRAAAEDLPDGVGREAGWIFEGDRRFAIVVQVPEQLRADLEALRNLPVALPGEERTDGPEIVLLQSLASFRLTERTNQVSREYGRRLVVVTAKVRGRDIVLVMAKARAAAEVRLPIGYFITRGGQFENLEAACQRLKVVVPAVFFLIFLLLYTAVTSPREIILVFSAVPLELTGGFAL